MTEGRTRRRARGGGGAARRAERTAVRIECARFIERKIPNLEILNDEAIEIIEYNAETVLEEVGVNFVDNPKALDRWREAGADVEGERVRIPRGLARALCKTAPSQFTQHARNPERSVVIGGNNLVLAPVYGPPFVRDVDGGRRYATMEDFRNFVKLAYMSKWLHEAGLYVEMAAPFRRHGLRADRCAGEQASPGHAARPYDPVGQALHGLGHGAGTGAGFG